MTFYQCCGSGPASGSVRQRYGSTDPYQNVTRIRSTDSRHLVNKIWAVQKIQELRVTLQGRSTKICVVMLQSEGGGGGQGGGGGADAVTAFCSECEISSRYTQYASYCQQSYGSGSISQKYGSGSFYHQAKVVSKTLIPTVL